MALVESTMWPWCLSGAAKGRADVHSCRESLATAVRIDVRAWLWPDEQNGAGRWIKYVIYVVREEQVDRTALDIRTHVGRHV